MTESSGVRPYEAPTIQDRTLIDTPLIGTSSNLCAVFTHTG